MAYLTKIFLDATAMHQAHIKDAYSLHRFVYSCFPQEEPEKRILYADHGAVDGRRMVLILSSREPIPPVKCPSAARIISDAFFSFNRYRFEVLLNPVHKDKETGKRVAVIGQLNLLNWFVRHAETWGINVDTGHLEVRTLSSLTFPRTEDTKCTFNRALYRGILNVSEPELFKKSFLTGLGHGKAFGFGLLQLVPLQQQNN